MRQIISRLFCHFAGLLRVSFLSMSILGACGALTLGRAHARLGETLSGFGEQLISWHDANPHSRVRTLYVNGVRFRLISMSFEESLGSTLDRFESACEESGGLLTPAGLLSQFEEAPTTFRMEGDGEGVLACFDTEGKQTAKEMFARVERFTQSGDLNELGSLRYVFARSGAGTTTALVLWPEGPVTLKAMFPGEGDALGRDPADVPRMPGTRRVFSAAESEQPYSVSLYRTPEDANALDWYRGALTKAGWTITKFEEKVDVILASRGSRNLLIRWTRDRGTVGILELS